MHCPGRRSTWMYTCRDSSSARLGADCSLQQPVPAAGGGGQRRRQWLQRLTARRAADRASGSRCSSVEIDFNRLACFSITNRRFGYGRRSQTGQITDDSVSLRNGLRRLRLGSIGRSALLSVGYGQVSRPSRGECLYKRLCAEATHLTLLIWTISPWHS